MRKQPAGPAGNKAAAATLTLDYKASPFAVSLTREGRANEPALFNTSGHQLVFKVGLWSDLAAVCSRFMHA